MPSIKCPKQPYHQGWQVLFFFGREGENLNFFFTKLPNILLWRVNNTLYNAKFPDNWKEGKVIPIPKTNSINLSSDSRPTTLQIEQYSQENNILSNNQNVSGRKKSTTQTIFKFSTDIYINININPHTLAIYVHLSNAFDAVNHLKLKEKLYKIGIWGNSHRWIDSYLESWKQPTFLNSDMSGKRIIEYKVLEVNALGLQLFLFIYKWHLW